MKKILILLIFCYSFSYSGSYWEEVVGGKHDGYDISVGEVLFYLDIRANDTHYGITQFSGGKVYLNPNSNELLDFTNSEYYEDSSHRVYFKNTAYYNYTKSMCTAEDPTDSYISAPYERITMASDEAECIEAAANNYKNVDYFEYDVCSVHLKMCRGIPIDYCGEGFTYDVNAETCVPDCTPLKVENPNPTEWIDFGITSEDSCTEKMISEQISGQFVSMDDGCGDIASGCFGSPDSPCNTVLSPESLRPDGFIYKNIVSNSSVCSSYVDGVNYLSSQVASIDDDCSSNNDYYCYLLPMRNDDNLTDDELPIENPDGTVDKDDPSFNELPINPDNDLSNPDNLNNQILEEIKNKLQNMNNDVSDYQHWSQDKFGNWKPIEDASKQLEATKDIKDSMTAVETVITDLDSNLGTKLDTINESIKDTNLTSEKIDLNDTNKILTDILDGNGTSLDGNGTSFFTNTYDNLKEQYDNVNSQVNSAVDFIKGSGLSNTVNTKTVNTCPKTFFFSLRNDLQKEFEIDPCIVLSQSREYMYTFSYIGFSTMFISFIVSMLVGL